VKTFSPQIALIFFVFSLLLLGCHEQKASIHNKLAGTWLCETNFPDGSKSEGTIIVDSNGVYFSHSASWGISNRFSELTIEGTWQSKDGFLIDTMTKSSQTSAKTPIVSRMRIIRFNDQELILQPMDFYPGDTNKWPEVIFRKEQK
jgi:hypothetical protein